jgi:putative selenium metabolism hydrolase
VTVDPVEVAAALIRVPCLSGQEGPMADAVESWMAELGYRDVRRDDFGSVVGVVGPEGNEVPLLFDGHMDVVPPAGEWTVDPFDPIVRDGRLYGRGATDMKGGLAAALVGVAAAARDLVRPVAVSATVLEETIEGVALGAVLDDVRPKAVVICEPTGLGLRIGQRGRAELLLTAHGIPAHAASPERGRNPITLMAGALERIGSMSLPRDDLLGPAIIVSTDVISDPYPSISLIPSSVTVRFDRRTLLDEGPDEVVAGLLEAASGGESELFFVRITTDAVETYTGERVEARRFLPAWRLDDSHPLVAALIAAVTSAGMPVEIGVWGFCTNGSESMGVRGIPTIGFGPGWPEDAHVIDESVSVEEVLRATEVYRRLAAAHAGEVSA